MRELSDSYRIVAAGDGQAGLEAARSELPDLILSDVMMPRMDGYEMCREIRQDPRLAGTPIVLLTAKAGDEALIEGLEGGADDFVTKPFGLRELRARIGTHLRAKSVEARLHEREARLAGIGQMTGRLIDDLRDPLQLVTGYADLARELAADGEDPKVIAGELDALQTAASRLRRMIQEILDYSLGRASELQIDRVPASRFLERALGPPLDDLRERRIEVSFDSRVAEGTEVQLDAERMVGVFENLVLNARDRVSTAETPRVAVSAGIEDSDLVVRIADNGPSLSKVECAHFFDSGDAPSSGLTAIGMSMSRNIVTAHGGDLGIRSPAEGRGATVILTLPTD